jgi:hypothetical protein
MDPEETPNATRSLCDCRRDFALFNLRLQRASGYGSDLSTGHDFRMSSDCSMLYLSTTTIRMSFQSLWRSSSPYGPLADLLDVKSFSVDPHSGRMVYTVADKGGYWTSTLRFALPESTAPLPVPIYKTRWVTDLPPSCKSN